MLNYMIKSAFATSDNIEKVIICDNSGNKSLRVYRKDKRIVTVPGRNKSTNSSLNHGAGLNRAMLVVNTELVAIIEPDVLLLNKGWSVLPDGIDLRACVKTTYSGVPCYYPSFMVGRTKKLKNIDFRPGGKGLKYATGAYNDTGWRISLEKLSVENLEHKSCLRGECDFIPNGVWDKRTNEFWLNGSPIAAHFWRGSEPARRGVRYKQEIKLWRNIATKISKRKAKGKVK